MGCHAQIWNESPLLMLNRLEPSLAADPDVDAAFDRAWTSADFAEGIDAFRTRRRPTFRGE